jgi:hypothetical protein
LSPCLLVSSDPISGLADAVRRRLPLARLAGVALWLAWLGSLAAGGGRYDATGHPLGADHVQYYVAGRLVAEGRAELVYDLPAMSARQAEVGGPAWKGVLPFRYPPFYALCFAATSRLPYEASWVVWTAASLLASAVAGWALGLRPGWAWLGWALCFYPVFAAVSFGQNSLLSLTLLALSYRLLCRERPFAAGAVAGLLLYKPQLLLGVGLLWLADRRRGWPALLGLAVAGAALAGASACLLPAASRAYLDSFGGIVGMQDRLALAQQQSTQGLWMLLLPGQDRLAMALSVACSLLGVGLFAAFRARARAELPVQFAVAVLLTPWLTPYVMIYDWSILLVPAALLWLHVPEERPRWLVLFALLWAVSLVSGPLVRAQLALLPVALHPSAPALALAAVATWRGLRAGGREGASLAAVPGGC